MHSSISWQEKPVIRVLVIFAASLLMAINLNTFVYAGDLFPGGFTGLARLILRCLEQYWGIVIPFSVVNLVVNAVPAIISFYFIGRRFTLYSCLMIVLTSVLTGIVPMIPITEDMLLLSVFGGIVNGLSVTLCLYVRTTSGGTDFLAIALAERKNIDAWSYILLGNAIMLSIAGLLFGWDKAMYSIIFQFSATQVLKMLDPESKRVTVLIVVREACLHQVCDRIRATNHTATLLEGTGLYDGEKRMMLYTVISNGQVRGLTQQIKAIDQQAFINVLPTEKVVGRFYHPPRN